MEKILCESLEEFKGLKEAEEGANPVGRVTKNIVQAPARAIRKARANTVMSKYKKAILNKTNTLMQKYFSNFDLFVKKVTSKISMIEKQKADEGAKINQMEELVKDIEKSLTEIITKMRSGIENILKVYADNFAKRLERKGTITGVEFSPEQKTNLESAWKMLEEDVNQYIQRETLKKIDNIKLDKLSELKAVLEEKVKNFKASHYNFYRGKTGKETKDDSTSDPNKIKGKKGEEDILEYFKDLFPKQLNMEFKFDTDYIIKNYNIFPNASKEGAKTVKFKIDNNKGKMAYKLNNNLYYFLTGDEDEDEDAEDVHSIIPGLK